LCHINIHTNYAPLYNEKPLPREDASIIERSSPHLPELKNSAGISTIPIMVAEASQGQSLRLS